MAEEETVHKTEDVVVEKQNSTGTKESVDRKRPAEESVAEKDNRGKKRKEIAQRQPRELKEGEVRDARKPKRKVGVLIGYCGTGYHGMQVNPPMKTIEGDLFAAFVKAGAISKDNADDPKKSSFMRAARTDKGVHAAGNVVSLKLIIEDPNIVTKINDNLPETVRVWGISRTNKSFECRKMCSSRVYEYLIPSYSFLPPNPSSAFAERIREAAAEFPDVKIREDKEGEQFWEDVSKKLEEAGISKEDAQQSFELEKQIFQQAAADASTAEAKAELRNQAEEQLAQFAGGKEYMGVIKKIKAVENQSRRAYRISKERLELVRAGFKLYEGSHNFHNFTIGKAFKDPSAKRYMKSLTVSDPMVINGTEWLSIKIHGQSFMLHQIRKMVAMVALVIRNGCPLERITEAFASTKISIPKAPSLGLLLEQPVYETYNKRLSEFGHGAITFDPHQEEIEAFKHKHIYDKIYTEEAKENVFYGFFGFIDSFRGDAGFDFLTARGIVDSQPVKEELTEEDKEELQGDTEG
ncbi:tRNA pseudouridine synthase 1 [Trichomonascus vanleenenianus]|uniref:pseudouridine synthase PUS1 n=1 Tax=Trichomonascus vanleenenianus TaxID=2268995 RepID=UPI003ECA8704